MSQQHKKIRAKVLRVTQTEGNKNYTSFMKNVDKFILDCVGLSLEHCGL